MMRSQELFQALDGRYVEMVISCLSDSVSASLLYHEEDKDPRVLCEVRRAIASTSGIPSREHIVDASYALLPELCDEIAAKSASLYEIKEIFKDDQHIHQVTCYLSYPWIEKKSYHHSQTFDKPTKITNLHINKLLDQSIPQGRTRLDNYIASTYANGYETTVDALLGQSVQEVTISVIDSYGRFPELETLFQIVSSHFNIEEKDLRFLPVLSATLEYTQAQYKPQINFVYIHMHGYNSDIVISHNGLLSYAGSLDFGYFYLAQALVDAQIASTLTQAWSLLAARANQEIGLEDEEAITKLFDGLGDSFINDMINKASPDESIKDVFTTLPRDWYIFGDKRLSQYFVQALRDDDHSRRTVIIASDEVHDSKSFHTILSEYGVRHDGVDIQK